MKAVLAFTLNWMKFNLYDQERKRDPFSSFELKYLFLGYFEREQEKLLLKLNEVLLCHGKLFIDFLEYFCLELTPCRKSNVFEWTDNNTVLQTCEDASECQTFMCFKDREAPESLRDLDCNSSNKRSYQDVVSLYESVRALIEKSA